MEFGTLITSITTAIFGGSVVGGIMKYLNFRKSRDEQEFEFERSWRNEMREELKIQRERIDTLKDSSQTQAENILKLKQQLSNQNVKINLLQQRLRSVTKELNKYRKRNDVEPIDLSNIINSIHEIVDEDDE